MVLETVFVLVLWNDTGQVHGTSFSKTEHVSLHQTEEKCDAAMQKYGKDLERTLRADQKVAPVMSCMKATRMSITGAKPKAQSWGEWWRSN
jgi:hypothetical protein